MLDRLGEQVGSGRVERDLNSWLSLLLAGFAYESDELEPLPAEPEKGQMPSSARGRPANAAVLARVRTWQG